MASFPNRTIYFFYLSVTESFIRSLGYVPTAQGHARQYEVFRSPPICRRTNTTLPANAAKPANTTKLLWFETEMHIWKYGWNCFA